MSNYVGKESQYIFSYPELGSDQPIESDRELGCDTYSQATQANGDGGGQIERTKVTSSEC